MRDELRFLIRRLKVQGIDVEYGLDPEFGEPTVFFIGELEQASVALQADAHRLWRELATAMTPAGDAA
jgi:hypothetical protein